MFGNFWKDQKGAVTVEWVVLFTLCTFLAMEMFLHIRQGVHEFADHVQTDLPDYTVTPYE
ncbi:MAG: hypothetical protein AAFQ54_03520 [Pseudomonadota bacterium]